MAPVAPAWAMARAAPDVAHDVTAIHAGHGGAQAAAQQKDRVAGAPAHRVHPADGRAHMSAVANGSQRAHAPDTERVSPMLHAHAANRQMVAGHSYADCGDGRCDGQCCGVCLLTFGGSVSHIAPATFAASDSPSYHSHAYTSFVTTILGRPPQS